MRFPLFTQEAPFLRGRLYEPVTLLFSPQYSQPATACRRYYRLRSQ